MPAQSEYWKKFYKQHRNDKALLTPSSFCLFVSDMFDGHDLRMLDAGCGNGRDTITLSKNFDVLGVDLIKQPTVDAFNFEQGNFCTINKDPFDLIYSRFTYHTISDEEQQAFLASIRRPGTLLCMEFRSDKDKDQDMYFGHTHYRNFVNLEKFKHDVTFSYSIKYLQEDKGFARFGDEDPHCIRAILEKK